MRLGEVKDRFDQFNQNNLKSKYKIIELKDVVSEAPKYGSNQSAIEYNGESRYIRITDIDEFGQLKNEGKKSASIYEEKYEVKENDLFFARSGSVGKTYLATNLQEKAIFAGYLPRTTETQLCVDIKPRNWIRILKN